LLVPSGLTLVRTSHWESGSAIAALPRRFSFLQRGFHIWCSQFDHKTLVKRLKWTIGGAFLHCRNRGQPSHQAQPQLSKGTLEHLNWGAGAPASVWWNP
jgi:hypothetical protein